MRPYLVILILLFMSGSLFVVDIRKLTYFTLVFLFFPIFIPFMGNDAITTGTICIFVLFVKYLDDSFRFRNTIKENFDYWIYLLIIIGAISVLSPYLAGTLESEQMGRAIRKFFVFLSALLFFLVVKNSQTNNTGHVSQVDNEHIEKLLSLFLILVSVHILISVLIKLIPATGAAFQPFLSTHVESGLYIHGINDIARIKSFIMTPEIYGEFLAVLCPIVFYKIFRFNKPIWFVCLCLFALGEIFSVTRSGIVLFVFGGLCCLVYYAKINIGRAVAAGYVLMIALLIILFVKPSFFEDVQKRFHTSIETYQSDGRIYEVLNRRVYLDAWETTRSNLTWFGNALTEFNFHNLLLTTIHKNGLIGASLFLIVLFYPFIRLMKSYKSDFYINRPLLFACILSVILFLINEMKFEFYRGSSYDQILWGLFATYYLVARHSFYVMDNKQLSNLS